MILELLNISNYNKNAMILLKMRGQATYGEVSFPRNNIFLHFQLFTAIFASFKLKMALFGADFEVKIAQCFKLQWKCYDSG